LLSEVRSCQKEVGVLGKKEKKSEKKAVFCLTVRGVLYAPRNEKKKERKKKKKK